MQRIYFSLFFVVAVIIFGATNLQAQTHSCLDGSSCFCYNPGEPSDVPEQWGECWVTTPGSPRGFPIGASSANSCEDYDRYVPGCDAYEAEQRRHREVEEATNEAAEEAANDNLENCQRGRKKFRRQRNECRANLAEVQSDLQQTRERASVAGQRSREALNACQSNSREVLANTLGQCMAIGNKKQDSLEAACALVSGLITRLPSISLNSENEAGSSNATEQWLADLKNLKKTVCGMSAEDIRALMPQRESPRIFRKSGSPAIRPSSPK